MLTRNWILSCALLALTGCGGGGSSGGGAGASPANDPAGEPCDGQCLTATSRLSVADVKRVLAQAIDQANALGVEATIAVVDRVGNVLAVHRMADTGMEITISSTFPNTVNTGLDGVIVPAGASGDGLASIAKAITGAYLSSEGNAFSTRTANQIVQENLNPGERNQPSGPLFGVQFSQLACSDFTRAFDGVGPSPGPHRSPLGLAADPGGFPLYKGGTPVGGVGAIADGRYSLDKNVQDNDRDIDEQIALAGSFGYAAPTDRRADRLTVEGKNLRFSDVEFAELAVAPDQAPAYDSLVDAGQLIAVNGYSKAQIFAGTVFGQPESGIRAATDSFANLDAFVFVDENGAIRYPLVRGTDGDQLQGAPLSVEEVRQLLRNALIIAERTRAQIRRPLGTFGRVTVAVTDTKGEILGLVRNRDAPVFGSDVSIQKARSTALLSSRDAASFLRGIPEPARYLENDFTTVKEEVDLGTYVDRAQAFIGPQALTDGTALPVRAIANLHRPFSPDGVEGEPSGPFSKDRLVGEWSVFSTGLQLDISFNKVLQHVLYAAADAVPDVGDTCNASDGTRLSNGLQIFASSVPVYRGSELIGGLGVAGDGPEQDEMMAFLGLHEAGLALGGSVNNAPLEIRSDRLTPGGNRLRFVQCPQRPFRDSDEENVCEGK
jgi:uncharacterized protein GlcG (DUF336 family)